VKIHVLSQGETVINADLAYQEPAIRTVINDMTVGSATGHDIASTILDCTDTERSGITCHDYAVVTEDSGKVLWSGWLTAGMEGLPDGFSGSHLFPAHRTGGACD
jgi:hypothetical protein